MFHILHPNLRLRSICRIVDNMPVTFCYHVETGNTYCLPGFPVGCFVGPELTGKNGCEKLVGRSFGGNRQVEHVIGIKSYFLQISKPQKDTFYLFNHVELLIQYHPKENDWGKDLPPDAARLVKVKVRLRRSGLRLYSIRLCFNCLRFHVILSLSMSSRHQHQSRRKDEPRCRRFPRPTEQVAEALPRFLHLQRLVRGDYNYRIC